MARSSPLRLLILGGTTEASDLARAVAGDARFAPLLSLAGVTRRPLPQPVPLRIGGFGGAAGLAEFLRAEGIGALVDATHPFAAAMTRQALAAAAETGTPLLRLERPPWRPVPGDDWREHATPEALAAALGPAPRRVFLTVGRKDLAAFRAAPWHDYLIRSVDPPPAEALPPRARVIVDTGPFAPEAELALLREARIEVLVAKNSGGTAVAAKLAAARALGLPVHLLARPAAPPGLGAVAEAGAALDWLARRHAGTERGA
ncbi:cobalt-precorrin-6A reductase [Roseomonas sp. KE0001]|uniref:cobalt-precorrin-6A reductase n=1 Tax=Roseomonas sp. KE0001 TaxID=2479201 RepID=UPI0018DF247D|nr:cobalt-precorrin-6A reductase [Roseomonas sp. KE0001]MBI0435308.1 cobalt-precorrin-6A reductase [Roseomonas sp. KE0001]